MIACSNPILIKEEEKRKKEEEFFQEVEMLTDLCLEILEKYDKGKIGKEETNWKCAKVFQELNTFVSIKEEDWGKRIWKEFKIWKTFSFLLNLQKIKKRAKDFPEVVARVEELENRGSKERLREKSFFTKLKEVWKSFFS